MSSTSQLTGATSLLKGVDMAPSHPFCKLLQVPSMDRNGTDGSQFLALSTHISVTNLTALICLLIPAKD